VRSKKCDVVTTVTTHVNMGSRYHMLLTTVMSMHSVRRLHQLSHKLLVILNTLSNGHKIQVRG
jgi:hypothetical protein